MIFFLFQTRFFFSINKYFHVHFCVCMIYKHVFKSGDSILGVVTRILQPESIVLKSDPSELLIV